MNINIDKKTMWNPVCCPKIKQSMQQNLWKY